MKGDLSSYKKAHNMNYDHFPKRTWKAGQDVVIAFQKISRVSMMTANVFFQSRRLDKSRTLLPDSSDDLNEPKPLQV